MFNMVGFLAAVTAASARALKSVLQGLMLSDSHERMDSLSLLMYMAPVAVVALIPTTLFFEPDAAAQAIELGRNGSECRRWGGGGGGGGGGPRDGRGGGAGTACVHFSSCLVLPVPPMRLSASPPPAHLARAAQQTSPAALVRVSALQCRPPQYFAPAAARAPPAVFWMLLLFNSFLAYFVNLTNFLVTKHTSALTLQVRREQTHALGWVWVSACESWELHRAPSRQAARTHAALRGPDAFTLRSWSASSHLHTRPLCASLPPSPCTARCWATPRAWWRWC